MSKIKDTIDELKKQTQSLVKTGNKEIGAAIIEQAKKEEEDHLKDKVVGLVRELMVKREQQISALDQINTNLELIDSKMKAVE